VAANGYVWLVTNYPLQQLYGFAARDRVGNLALCQVVAAGNSPLRTAQLGQLHFEPFWGLLVALLSGFEPDRVLRLYPYFALLAAAGFTVSLYFGLRPPNDGEGQAWSGWERALMAAFATLLSSSPLEFTGIYRLPWSLTFLLKPNHAMGLVLFPIVLYVFVRARGFAGRLLAGFLLHLLAWAFVLHMAYVAAGLVLHAVLSFATRHPERGRDLRDVAVTIGVNVLIVSPYLVMLLVGYPFLVPSALQTIAVTSPHLLEVTARAAPIAALGIWGAICAWRRQDRLGRVWAAQVAAAYFIWAGFLLLSALQQARERDDTYYWVRFLTAASAGLGAWDLARRVARTLPRPLAPATTAALVALLVLPLSLPYWYDPALVDPYFAGSRAPIEQRLLVPTDFLRHSTPRDAVILTDGDFARFAAALGARRVLLADNFHRPGDVVERFAFQDAVLTDDTAGSVRALAARWAHRHPGPWYAAVTSRWLRSGTTCTSSCPPASTPPPVTLGALRRRPHMQEVYFWGDEAGEFVAVFKLETS
jgi:hypothetical protein